MLTNEHALELRSLATVGTQEFFMNNIYESFMVIYGHFCSAAGKKIYPLREIYFPCAFR